MTNVHIKLRRNKYTTGYIAEIYFKGELVHIISHRIAAEAEIAALEWANRYIQTERQPG